MRFGAPNQKCSGIVCFPFHTFQLLTSNTTSSSRSLLFLSLRWSLMRTKRKVKRSSMPRVFQISVERMNLHSMMTLKVNQRLKCPWLFARARYVCLHLSNGRPNLSRPTCLLVSVPHTIKPFLTDENVCC